MTISDQLKAMMPEEHIIDPDGYCPKCTTALCIFNHCLTQVHKILDGVEVDIEKTAIACYTSLEGSTKEDWKIESKEIHREFRGYAQAIAQSNLLKVKEEL